MKYPFKAIFIIILLGVSNAPAQQVEWIKVYFNMPALIDSSKEIQINDEWDLIGTLEELIDSATTSVDLCVYDLEHQRIGNALVRAKKRGVRVRLITDDHNRMDSRDYDPKMWDLLGNAGIYSMDDDGDIYKNSTTVIDFDLVNNSADMHHKFAIIDRASSTLEDDKVWTGSTNLTYTGAFNSNNVVVIKDAEIAEFYEKEFEQMWGGENTEANPELARFHKDKIHFTPNIFDVNGTKIEIYFAPQNRDKTKPSISDRLVDLVNEETESDIKFLAFSFTPTIPLAQAIWSKTDNTNIQLEGVIDPGFYSRYKNAAQIWGSKEAQSGNRMVLPAREMRKLHHKILLIDAESLDSTDVASVVTGSYNFSKNAEYNNDENLLIIHSDEIAAQYLADFKGTVARAKGEIQAPVPSIETDKWYNVYAIRDGKQFEIEIFPGFGYPVRLLGVDIPSIYSGKDSSDYFAGETAEFLQDILEGRKVRLKGVGDNEPISQYGFFKAYVDVDYDGHILALNSTMIKRGYGLFSNFNKQHSDSVYLFKEIQQIAENNKIGIWARPSLVGSKVERSSIVNKGNAVDVIYPININTADLNTLKLLPGIGQTYAQRIIDFREQYGGFDRVEQLLEIKGIGEIRFQRLRPIVTL